MVKDIFLQIKSGLGRLGSLGPLGLLGPRASSPLRIICKFVCGLDHASRGLVEACFASIYLTLSGSSASHCPDASRGPSDANRPSNSIVAIDMKYSFSLILSLILLTAIQPVFGQDTGLDIGDVSWNDPTGLTDGPKNIEDHSRAMKRAALGANPINDFSYSGKPINLGAGVDPLEDSEAPEVGGMRSLPLNAMIPKNVTAHTGMLDSDTLADTTRNTVASKNSVLETTLFLTESAVAQGIATAHQKAANMQIMMQLGEQNMMKKAEMFGQPGFANQFDWCVQSNLASMGWDKAISTCQGDPKAGGVVADFSKDPSKQAASAGAFGGIIGSGKAAYLTELIFKGEIKDEADPNLESDRVNFQCLFGDVIFAVGSKEDATGSITSALAGLQSGGGGLFGGAGDVLGGVPDLGLDLGGSTDLGLGNDIRAWWKTLSPKVFKDPSGESAAGLGTDVTGTECSGFGNYIEKKTVKKFQKLYTLMNQYCLARNGTGGGIAGAVGGAASGILDGITGGALSGIGTDSASRTFWSAVPESDLLDLSLPGYIFNQAVGTAFSKEFELFARNGESFNCDLVKMPGTSTSGGFDSASEFFGGSAPSSDLLTSTGIDNPNVEVKRWRYKINSLFEAGNFTSLYKPWYQYAQNIGRGEALMEAAFLANKLDKMTVGSNNNDLYNMAKRLIVSATRTVDIGDSINAAASGANEVVDAIQTRINRDKERNTKFSIRTGRR